MPDHDVFILYRLPGKTPRSVFQRDDQADEDVQVVDRELKAAGYDTRILAAGDDVAHVLTRVDPQKTVVFNYCDGYHENNTGYDPITRVYERLGLVYTGADDKTLQQSCYKANLKAMLVRHGVPTPGYRVLAHDHIDGWSIFPAFVKPARLHSSMGILPESLVETPAQLRRQVQRIVEELGQPALVEDFIEGDEFRVSVLGNEEPRVLPFFRYAFIGNGSRRYPFQDYATKWVDIKGRWELQPWTHSSLHRHIEAVAKAAFRAVRARDYAGIDIRVRDGIPFVIDPNHNPDISEGSFIMRSLEAAGLDNTSLSARIVEIASERLPRYARNAG